MLRECDKCVLRLLQEWYECYNSVTRVLHKCYESVTIVILKCDKSVTYQEPSGRGCRWRQRQWQGSGTDSAWQVQGVMEDLGGRVL